jgi:hypothetical protein
LSLRDETKAITPEQITVAIHEAQTHIESSGGKKTPGVQNRRALIAIIEQLRAENERLLDAALEHFSKCTDPHSCVYDHGEPTLWLGCAEHIRRATRNKETPR